MQPFCFEFGDRYIDAGHYQIAFRIYTEFNVYTPDPDSIKISRDGDRITVTSDRFAWAGLQR